MNNIRVLIAEDEPPMGRFIRTAVEKEGFNVYGVCENAEDILARLEKFNIDLLITSNSLLSADIKNLIMQKKR